MKQKSLNKEQKKEFKKIIDRGMWEYIWTQGGKAGILFSGLMFLINYFIFNESYGVGTYLFYILFFGGIMGLWGWYYINKKYKENE
jgi:hypothetical protein